MTKDTFLKSPHLRRGDFRYVGNCNALNSMEEHSGRNLKYALIVVHSEREAFFVRKTGNIKENLEKLPKVAPPDGTLKESTKSSRVWLDEKETFNIDILIIPWLKIMFNYTSVQTAQLI